MTRAIILRDAYRKWIPTLGVTHFVTFNFGYKIKPLDAEHAIKGFCGRIERPVLGRNYFKILDKPRLILIGFAERKDINPHWHAVARVPQTMRPYLEFDGEEIWERLEPRGQLWVERIRNEREVISYCTKRVTLSSLESTVVYSPNPAPVPLLKTLI